MGFKLMAWAKNGTPDTLSGTGDLLTITDLVAATFNVFLGHAIASGQTEPLVTFNNETTGLYANRFSTDGGSDSTGTTENNLFLHTAANSSDNFDVMYTINISAEEKLCIYWSIGAGSAGASTVPQRREFVGKWITTGSQITEIDHTNGGTGSFLINSNLSALGTD